MIEPPEPLRIPDQWICVECGDSMGYVLDRRHGIDLTDREVYTLCARCFLKRSKQELTARLSYVVDQLRALGYDVAASVDGEEV